MARLPRWIARRLTIPWSWRPSLCASQRDQEIQRLRFYIQDRLGDSTQQSLDSVRSFLFNSSKVFAPAAAPPAPIGTDPSPVAPDQAHRQPSVGLDLARSSAPTDARLRRPPGPR